MSRFKVGDHVQMHPAANDVYCNEICTVIAVYEDRDEYKYKLSVPGLKNQPVWSGHSLLIPPPRHKTIEVGDE